MQIVVTGACSLLGQAVLRAIATRDLLMGALGVPVRVERIIAIDRAQPAKLFVEARVEYVCGNFEQSRFLARVMGTGTDSIFHLSSLGAAAGIGGHLDDLDLALMRSLDTTRSLVDACQFQLAQPRLILASAAAAQSDGRGPPASVEGICSAMCELFLIECARRGYVDLRGVRLPRIAGNEPGDNDIAPVASPAGLAVNPVPPQPGTEPAQIPMVTADEAAEALVDAHEQAPTIPGPAPMFDLPGHVRPAE
jgi:nucleoside-diphosphate-sugar epimerase